MKLGKKRWQKENRTTHEEKNEKNEKFEEKGRKNYRKKKRNDGSDRISE